MPIAPSAAVGRDAPSRAQGDPPSSAATIAAAPEVRAVRAPSAPPSEGALDEGAQRPRTSAAQLEASPQVTSTTATTEPPARERATRPVITASTGHPATAASTSVEPSTRGDARPGAARTPTLESTRAPKATAAAPTSEPMANPRAELTAADPSTPRGDDAIGPRGTHAREVSPTEQLDARTRQPEAAFAGVLSGEAAPGANPTPGPQPIKPEAAGLNPSLDAARKDTALSDRESASAASTPTRAQAEPTGAPEPTRARATASPVTDRGRAAVVAAEQTPAPEASDATKSATLSAPIEVHARERPALEEPTRANPLEDSSAASADDPALTATRPRTSAPQVSATSGTPAARPATEPTARATSASDDRPITAPVLRRADGGSAPRPTPGTGPTPVSAARSPLGATPTGARRPVEPIATSTLRAAPRAGVEPSLAQATAADPSDLAPFAHEGLRVLGEDEPRAASTDGPTRTDVELPLVGRAPAEAAAGDAGSETPAEDGPAPLERRRERRGVAARGDALEPRFEPTHGADVSKLEGTSTPPRGAEPTERSADPIAVGPSPTQGPSGDGERTPSGGLDATPALRAYAEPREDEGMPTGQVGTRRAAITLGEGDERVTLAVDAAAGRVTVEATAHSPGVARALAEYRGELREALRTHGLELGGFSASTGGGQPSPQREARDERGAPTRDDRPNPSGATLGEGAPRTTGGRRPGVRVVA